MKPNPALWPTEFKHLQPVVRKVWVKKIGHWTDSNPGYVDHWIDEGFEVTDYPVPGATEVVVQSKAI